MLKKHLLILTIIGLVSLSACSMTKAPEDNNSDSGNPTAETTDPTSPDPSEPIEQNPEDYEDIDNSTYDHNEEFTFQRLDDWKITEGKATESEYSPGHTEISFNNVDGSGQDRFAVISIYESTLEEELKNNPYMQEGEQKEVEINDIEWTMIGDNRYATEHNEKVYYLENVPEMVIKSFDFK